MDPIADTAGMSVLSPDSDYSLRPMYSRQSQFSFTCGSSKQGSFLSRKRLRSVSDENAHSHRPCFSSNADSWTHLGNFPAYDTGNLKESLKETARNMAEAHCNKSFALKISSKTVSNMSFHLPLPEKFFTAKLWMVEGLQQLKKELNDVKGNVQRGEDLSAWTHHTASVNPASKIINKFREKAQPEFISQAFLKMYEVLCRYPIVPSDCTSFSSVHLCEAPGGFIVALNHYLKLNRPNAKFSWLSNTLNPHYEGCDASECISDDRIILHTLPNWVFGPDGLGNLTSRSCLEEIIDRSRQLPNSVGLVTADGSIDCQANPGEQETTTSRLHLCEALTALLILADHGNLVLKMFTFFESCTICLLYFLCCAFDEVHVYKPITSKLGNSEVYVVCLLYKGQKAMQGYLDKFLEVLYLNDMSSECTIIPEADVSQKFIGLIKDCANYFKSYQTNAILRNAELYYQMNSENSAFCSFLQDIVWEKFKEANNPIAPINHCDRLISVTVEWDSNIHPKFFKYKDWTGYSAKDDNLKKATWIKKELNYCWNKFLQPEKILTFSLDALLLSDLSLTKGKPLTQVVNSRFCFDRLLLLYNSLINMTKNFDQCSADTKLSSHVTFYKKGDTIFDPLINEDSFQLLFSYENQISDSHVLVQTFTGHRPSLLLSCELLQKLFNLLFSDALDEDSNICLMNFPLLTRLQVSLFLVAAACFKRVEFHSSVTFSNTTLNPPLLKLCGLQRSICLKACRALDGLGWDVNSPPSNILAVLATPDLVRYSSHKHVCRYNAELMLTWAYSVCNISEL